MRGREGEKEGMGISHPLPEQCHGTSTLCNSPHAVPGEGVQELPLAKGQVRYVRHARAKQRAGFGPPAAASGPVRGP